ncbi:MAG: cyclic nucleotide-binding domain-containing protein [Rhodospirillaceae bacterium]|nr:cyclic nucleotide-binding domain-containing protein [Rhodospirillaceae bacterium]
MAKRKQSFTNGQVIYREGDDSDRAFEVLSGAVELLADGPEGDTRVGVARTGEMFGEQGLIEGGVRDQTARAVGAVVVRSIVREATAGPTRGGRQRSGFISRLLERFGGRRERASNVSTRPPVAEAPGLFQRMMYSVHPPEGRIEVRVAKLGGDEGNAQARLVVAALEQFRAIRVKLIDTTLEIDVNKGLARELLRINRSGRRLLRQHDGDLLIWGHVPTGGMAMHLHFVARGDWDERLPGAFSLATDLPLPLNFDAAAAELLHGVALSATRPKRGEQAEMRTAILPEVAEAVDKAMAAPEPTLGARERAGMMLCQGNVHAALWAQTRDMARLDQAYNIYHKALGLLSGDEAAIDWAIAHKHLSAIAFMRAEEGGGAEHYDEAAAAALAALDTLSRETYPLDWAALHYKLGAIHYKLGFESGDTDVLRRALRHHRNALKAYSRKHTPERWAEVMAAFGQAAQVFGEHVKSLEALATAVNACRAVLEVRDRRKTPLAWAAAQNNLGSALFLLGKKARNPERLDSAAAAFEEALKVYRARKLYRLAAVTEKNLERAQDMIDWYSPDGIPIVDFGEPPVIGLAARSNRIDSSQAIEVIE